MAGGSKGEMNLDLATKDGRITGSGSDSVGEFKIDGTVSSTTLKFKKVYPKGSKNTGGSYYVEYDGTWGNNDDGD
jgi:hypothetical protein